MFDDTFKRDPALKPLSRDHGVLLVLVQRLRKAAAGTPKERVLLAGEIRNKFCELVEQYLADETAALAAVDFSELVRNEVVHDHANITLEIKRLARMPKQRLTSASFSALADLIEQHIRWDERMVLPYLQRELSDSQRSKLQIETSALEASHSRPTAQLHHSRKLDKAAGVAQTCSCADSIGID